MSSVEDFKGSSGLWVKSYGTAGVDPVQTYSYRRWFAMRNRCGVGSITQTRRPTPNVHWL